MVVASSLYTPGTVPRVYVHNLNNATLWLNLAKLTPNHSIVCHIIIGLIAHSMYPGMAYLVDTR